MESVVFYFDLSPNETRSGAVSRAPGIANAEKNAFPFSPCVLFVTYFSLRWREYIHALHQSFECKIMNTRDEERRQVDMFCVEREITESSSERRRHTTPIMMIGEDTNAP